MKYYCCGRSVVVRVFIFCGWIYFLSYAGLGQTQHTSDSLIIKVEQFVNAHRLNGGILLANEDSIMYERYYGYADRGKKTKMGAENAMQIASTSKTFTAMAILKLHQEGKLSIYDTVANIIAGFPYKDIQIIHLLCHKSGIPYYAFFLPRQRSKMYTNQDVLKHIIRYKPKLNFKTNTRFKYCNTNYVILASIIEQVTQMTFEQYLQKIFWKPYGLEHTFVLDGSHKLGKATPSYSHRHRKYSLMAFDYIYGDKGIYSTPRDLFKWHLALSDTTLFFPKTLKLAYHGFAQIYDEDAVKAYGLGWRVFYTKDYYKVAFHNGWWHGNKSLFMRIPELNVVMIALDNTSASSIYRLGNYISYFINNTPAAKEINFDEHLNINGLNLMPR